jgi:hypothetical protein
VQKLIPQEGISLRLTIPITSAAYNLRLSSEAVSFSPTRRFGALNQEVLGFTEGAIKTWGLGGTIIGGINDPALDTGLATNMTLVPGESYLFNFKREDFSASANYVILGASTFAV